jgi:hypothetical protein
MPKLLNRDQVERFHRDGFLLPIPVLIREDTLSLRE